MPQILKIGNTIFKNGNIVFRYPTSSGKLQWLKNDAIGTVNGSGSGVVYDEVDDTIYIGNWSGTVYKYSAGTLSLIASFSVNNQPRDLYIDRVNRVLFVNQHLSSTISMYNLSDLSLKGNVTGSISTGAKRMAFSYSESNLFLINGQTLQVRSLINPNLILSTVTQAQGGFSTPISLAVSDNDGKIYVSNADGTISIQSLSSPATQLAKITCPPIMFGDAADTQVDRLYCIDSSNTMYIRKRSDPTINLATIPNGQNGLPALNNAGEMAIDRNRGMLYIMSNNYMTTLSFQ